MNSNKRIIFTAIKRMLICILIGAFLGFIFCVAFARVDSKPVEINEMYICLIQKARDCDPDNFNRWFLGMKFNEDALAVFFHEPANRLNYSTFLKANRFSTSLVFEKDSIQCLIR